MKYMTDAQEVSGKVIGIGHCTVDIVCPTATFPQIDTKTEIPAIAVQGGGPAANAMAALAKLGVRTALVSRLGTEILGQFARRDLLRRDVECTHLFMDQETASPLSVVITEAEKRTRTIIVYKGENREVDPRWLEEEWLATGEVLHIDGHQLPASLKAAANFKRRGKEIVFDAGNWREGTDELLALATTVIASKTFADKLSENADEALAKLLAFGPKLSAITLGAKGATAYDGERFVSSQGFVVDVKDTTGAGDVFHGAYIYGLLHGMEIPDRLRFANAAAAIKCTGVGARGTLPTAEEVFGFLRERGA